MPGHQRLELDLALEVHVDGSLRQVSVLVGHHVADEARAATRTLGLGDELLAELWRHVRSALPPPVLGRLATDEAARADAASEQQGPVATILARHGYALDDLRLAVTAPTDDPVLAAARARAAHAADAAALGAAGVRAHSAFDAAGHHAT